MSDISNAPAGEAQPVAAPVSTPAESNAPISMRDAASALSKRRWEKAKEQQAAPAEASQPEPVEQQELAETPDDAQPEAVDPVETTETQPEPAEPPIEPPRSWTKEAKERWQSLPRETQEYLSTREQERDRALRQSQNEAAEKLKGLTAKEQQAEQAIQRYEAALPALLQTLQELQQGEFSDIRSYADAHRLSQEDPTRYLKWRSNQDLIEAKQRENSYAQERQANEFRTKWSEFAAKEDQLILDKVPDLADKTKAQKIADSAVNVLKEIGFSERDLASAWNGESSVSLRDHRIQLLIMDAIKYREGKANANKIIAKPLPPVQKPGVAAPRSNDANIQTLSKKLETTGRMEDAAALVMARRAARR